MGSVGRLVVVGVAGAVLGAAAGAVWQDIAAASHRACLIEDARDPESFCGLGVVVWGPVLVGITSIVIALSAAVLAGWARTARAPMVGMSVLCVCASAALFTMTRTWGSYRVAIPAVLLGLGFCVATGLMKDE